MKVAVAKSGMTISCIGIATLFSIAPFSISNVPRQLALASIWFVAGYIVAALWHSR